jgi:hypothetical protein
MDASKRNAQQELTEEQQKFQEQERQKLIVQRVKLPNGATFTRLKSVTA